MSSNSLITMQPVGWPCSLSQCLRLFASLGFMVRVCACVCVCVCVSDVGIFVGFFCLKKKTQINN